MRHINKKLKIQLLEETPKRWIKAINSFNSTGQFPLDDFTLFKNESKLDYIIEAKEIEVWSLCSHHLFPYSCKINIKYIPSDFYCGLSKLARVSKFYAKRPSAQEELTQDIFNFLKTALKPKKLSVSSSEGMHTCSASRGVECKVGFNVTIGDKDF